MGFKKGDKIVAGEDDLGITLGAVYTQMEDNERAVFLDDLGLFRDRSGACYRLWSPATSGEHDPNGVDAHSPGAKLDAGKTEFGLIMNGMPRALRQVARVATYGANKYTRNGWLSVPDGPRRYTDALYRHLNAEACGELHDPDTQLEHAAHAAWNALARLELLLRGQGTA